MVGSTSKEAVWSRSWRIAINSCARTTYHATSEMAHIDAPITTSSERKVELRYCAQRGNEGRCRVPCAVSRRRRGIRSRSSRGKEGVWWSPLAAARVGRKGVWRSPLAAAAGVTRRALIEPFEPRTLGAVARCCAEPSLLAAISHNCHLGDRVVGLRNAVGHREHRAVAAFADALSERSERESELLM